MSEYTDIYKHALEMQNYPFIVEQVDRIYPILQAIQGTRNAPTRKEVLEHVSFQVAVLEAHPEMEQTTFAAGISTVRAPGNHSYMINLWAASVSTMELALFEEREKDA